MARLSIATLLYLAALSVALFACGLGEGAPAIERVRPESVAPGGLVIVSGRGLDSVRSATIGGRAAASVSPVNATLLTVVAPADLPPGEHELRLTTSAGRRAIAAVRVDTPTGRPGAVAGVGPPAPIPSATPAPSPTARPAPTATPAQTATPVPGRTSAPVLAPAPARAAPSPPPATPPARRGDDDDRDKDDERDDDKDEKDKKDEDNRPGNGRGRGRS